MRQRCSNERNPSYSYYGGRGIRVCERWAQFENFLADMGERPDGTTLDRKDVNGDYEPNNCKWATLPEQQHNTRYTKLSIKVVRQIRWLVEMGYSWARVGRMFDVKKSAVQDVIRGRSWRTV